MLEREWPDELERYRRLYPGGGSGYLRTADGGPIQARIAAVKRGAGISDRRRIRLMPEPQPEQLSLAMG